MGQRAEGMGGVPAGVQWKVSVSASEPWGCMKVLGQLKQLQFVLSQSGG